jgi:HEAT repeat protein
VRIPAPTRSRSDWDAVVRRLDFLKETDRAANEILAIGAPVVPALVRFLLDGPRLHPEPRMCAARLLATIGGTKAADGLALELAALDGRFLSPALRLSEEAVADTAACGLGHLLGPAAIPHLRYAFARHRLVAAAETLAGLGDEASIPGIVDALEDDFKRGRLLQALGGFGKAATVEALAVLAEPGSSVDDKLGNKRRIACATFVAERWPAAAREVLRRCLGSRDPELRREAAIGLANHGVDGAAIRLELAAGTSSEDARARLRSGEALAMLEQSAGEG